MTEYSIAIDEIMDDFYIDEFANIMKAKMTQKRVQGRNGWNDKSRCSNETLSKMLREHVEKGDPIDVAIFSMMLYSRQERILP